MLLLGVILLISLSLVGYYRFKIRLDKISSKVSTNFRSIQRKTVGDTSLDKDTVVEFLEGSLSRDKTDFARDLEKKLYCAGWHIPRSVFHLIEVGISVGAVLFSYLFLTVPFVVFSIFIGPLICRGILDFIVERKARAFERDFPHFLMSTVSLLKTGVTPLIAMESSAKALDEGSLIKREVEVFIESVRNGFNEEKALSRFADTIYSPAIETFVQIMLAGKRFGGSLSEALERLASSVRKREAFRLEAIAALGQAKASMWVVLGAFMLCLLIISNAFEGFKEAFSTSLGRAIFHFVIVLNLVAMIIFRYIVRIKV